MNLYLVKLRPWVHLPRPCFEHVVVCAESRQEAARIHPSEDYVDWDGRSVTTTQWAGGGDLEVVSLGKAKSGIKPGVVYACFQG